MPDMIGYAFRQLDDSRRWTYATLAEKDSNPHVRSQSPLCYHYTIGQFIGGTVPKTPLFVKAIRQRRIYPEGASKGHTPVERYDHSPWYSINVFTSKDPSTDR